MEETQNPRHQQRSVWERMISLVSPSAAPNDTPPTRRVGPHLWVVDRQRRLAGDLIVPTRSTVRRVPNGELLLHSPCELTDATRKNLAFNMCTAPNRTMRVLWDIISIRHGFGPRRTAPLMLLRDRPPVGNFVRRLLEWPVEPIVITHGKVLESVGRAALESAFAAYL